MWKDFRFLRKKQLIGLMPPFRIFLDATSRSPSFKSGMTSESFQTSSYVEDIRDLSILLVNGIR
jgi:hypothetical protein